MSKLRTRYEQMTSGGLDGYDNFAGDDTDYREWFGFVGQSRDSGALERSNFEVATAELERIDPEGTDWRTERYGHWAVGWIEETYVRPGSKCQEYAEEIREALENYPVIDEEHYSDLETAEADEVWKTCFNWRERLEYVRENPDQFEPYSLADLLGCVRGEYFGGYAGELLH